jgi:hypothetical protein
VCDNNTSRSMVFMKRRALIQCDQLFCEDCKISHLRLKVCRNHTFLSGANIHVQQKAKVECADHKEDFIFFCEECDVLICRVCTTKTQKYSIK